MRDGPSLVLLSGLYGRGTLPQSSAPPTDVGRGGRGLRAGIGRGGPIADLVRHHLTTRI